MSIAKKARAGLIVRICQPETNLFFLSWVRSPPPPCVTSHAQNGCSDARNGHDSRKHRSSSELHTCLYCVALACFPSWWLETAMCTEP